MKPMEEGDGKAYFKGWDEWDHHSICLLYTSRCV